MESLIGMRRNQHWEETERGWKTRARFKIRSLGQVRQTISVLEGFLAQMEFASGQGSLPLGDRSTD